MGSRSLGTLTLDLIAKTGGFESGMDKAARYADKRTREIERQAKERAKAIDAAFTGIADKIAGAFAGLQIVQFANQTLELQGRLDDLTKSTGLSVTTLAGLEHAARMSGSNLDTVASAVNKLAVNMGKDAEKFAKLGVTAKDPIDALGQLADILNGIDDPQKRAAVAADALGKSWQELAPLLSEGSRGIRALTDEGVQLSGVTDENNKRAAEFGDNLEKLKTGSIGLANSILNPLLPALNDLIGKFTEAAKAKNIFGWAITSGNDENNAVQKYEEISEKLAKLREMRDALSKPTFANKLNDIVFGDVRDLNTQITFLEKKQDYLKNIIDLQKKAETTPDTPTTKTNPAAVNSFLNSGKDTTTKAITDGQRLIEQLQSRLMTAQKLTEVERLEAELAANKYAKATPAEREIALSLASQIDFRNTIAKQLDDELASVREINKQYEEQESRLNQLLEATPMGQNIKQMQDEALAESALMSGKIDQSTYDQIIAKLHEVKDEGKDAFGELQSAIEGWGRASADAFVEFAFTGKMSFGDLTTSILKDISRMLMYQNVTKPLSQNIGSWFGMAASAIGSFFGGGSSDVIPMQPGGGYAKGGIFESGLEAFAQGGIVNSPTFFKFASGGSFKKGLMGEAGPEAILPLKRGSDGSLGVSMNGSGSSGDTYVNITINQNGDSSESTESSRGNQVDDARKMAKQIEMVVLETITKQKAPGGGPYR